MDKKNLGQTRLRKRRRASDPMTEFDRMPKLLREWLNGAALPWAPKSVYRAYNRALRQTGDPDLALRQLEKLQQQKLSIDRNL